jgi:hypothetical protein
MGTKIQRDARKRRGLEITLSDEERAKLARIAERRHAGNKSAAIGALIMAVSLILIGCSGADGGGIGPSVVAPSTSGDTAAADGGLAATAIVTRGDAAPAETSEAGVSLGPDAGDPHPETHADAGCSRFACTPGQCGLVVDACGDTTNCGTCTPSPTVDAGRADAASPSWLAQCEAVSVPNNAPVNRRPTLVPADTICVVGTDSYATTLIVYLCPIGVGPQVEASCGMTAPAGESTGCSITSQLDPAYPPAFTAYGAYWCAF